MAKIEPKIFDELKTALVSFGDKYFVGEELNRSKLAELTVGFTKNWRKIS